MTTPPVPDPESASSIVELCESCRHFIRRGSSSCPFCSATHAAPAPRRRAAAARTRIALASGAALLAVACGGGDADTDTNTNTDSNGSGGGEVVQGELSDDGSGGDHDAEPNCAGTCGSHHHPACMDDPVDPCPAPPYGAPPGELWV